MKTVTGTVVLLTFFCLLTIGLASAEGRVVAVADQNAQTLRDPLWQALGTKRTRANVAWNIATGDPDIRTVALLDAARTAHVKVLVTWHPAGDSLPTQEQFTRAFLAFRQRWPEIREFATWNEPNLRGTMTNARPSLVARYWKVMRARCLGCTVIAPELVDFPSAPRWARRFEKAVGESGITWGLHNYRDVNRFVRPERSITAAMLRAVKGPIWLTETGGIVRFGDVLAFDEARAARATDRVFSVANLDRERIKRIYLYHWRAPVRQAHWDSGLLTNAGQPRKSFWILANRLGKTQAARRALAARETAPTPVKPGEVAPEKPDSPSLLCLFLPVCS